MFCYFIPASEYDLQSTVMVDADTFDHLADDGIIIHIDAGSPAINRSLYFFQAFLFTWVLFSFLLSRVYSALQLFDLIGNPSKFIFMMLYAFSGLDASLCFLDQVTLSTEKRLPVLPNRSGVFLLFILMLFCQSQTAPLLLWERSRYRRTFLWTSWPLYMRMW